MKNLFIVLLLLISNICISQKVIGYYQYNITHSNSPDHSGKYEIYDNGTSKRIPQDYSKLPIISTSDVLYFAPNSELAGYIRRDNELAELANIRSLNANPPISSSNRGVSKGTQMSDFNKIQTPASTYNTTRVSINFNNSSK